MDMLPVQVYEQQHTDPHVVNYYRLRFHFSADNAWFYINIHGYCCQQKSAACDVLAIIGDMNIDGFRVFFQNEGLYYISFFNWVEIVIIIESLN